MLFRKLLDNAWMSYYWCTTRELWGQAGKLAQFEGFILLDLRDLFCLISGIYFGWHWIYCSSKYDNKYHLSTSMTTPRWINQILHENKQSRAISGTIFGEYSSNVEQRLIKSWVIFSSLLAHKNNNRSAWRKKIETKCNFCIYSVWSPLQKYIFPYKI